MTDVYPTTIRRRQWPIADRRIEAAKHWHLWQQCQFDAERCERMKDAIGAKVAHDRAMHHLQEHNRFEKIAFAMRRHPPLD
jgi:hypothetical protein